MERAHEGLAGLIDIRVILTDAHEHKRVALAIHRLRSQPAVAVVAPIRFDNLLRDRVKLRDFFWLRLDYVHVEVISLR